MIEITPEYQQVFDAIERKDPFIFVSGRAGTGKTTLVDHIRNTLDGNVVVVAPTGVAALQVKGVTIHSFFKFPPRFIFPEQDIKKLKDRRLYSKLRLLIIDEVSMVRADMIDAIDLFLRVNGPNERVPFGGVQVLFVGDLFQLPPVVRQEEMQILNERSYNGPFFFDAMVLHRQDLTCVELNKIFRQKDSKFIELLNQIRMNEQTEVALEEINSCCFSEEKALNQGGITLTTTNAKADSMNMRALNGLHGESKIFLGQVSGKFKLDDRNLPAPMQLELKIGARVMLTANDTTYPKRWVNGSLGSVVGFAKDVIRIELDETIRQQIIEVPLAKWESYEYIFDEQSQSIVPNVIGTYQQYPLVLAWAVTIHKSQGKTLNQVNIDFSGGAFAPGQVYVALSRCTELDGIHLNKKIQLRDVYCDQRIKTFHRRLIA